MTRKHYTMIADAMKKSMDDAATYEQAEVLIAACSLLADKLAEENSRFDRDRFMTACGAR